ncbi:Uncharacterised protein [uncultured archaeon]|nr:Uncharacterised protein [uncultured archaeon]
MPLPEPLPVRVLPKQSIVTLLAAMVKAVPLLLKFWVML